MRSEKRAVRGSFNSSFDDLLPLMAVQPHQLSAARRPSEPIRNIVGKAGNSQSDLGRLVNDRLCGSARH